MAAVGRVRRDRSLDRGQSAGVGRRHAQRDVHFGRNHERLATSGSWYTSPVRRWQASPSPTRVGRLSVSDRLMATPARRCPVRCEGALTAHRLRSSLASRCNVEVSSSVHKREPPVLPIGAAGTTIRSPPPSAAAPSRASPRARRPSRTPDPTPHRRASSGSCIDNAGKTVCTTFPFAYDATPPAVSALPSRSPDHNGWYNHPVTFAFGGTDATSGIAGCSTVTYSGPASGSATVTGSCSDRAGNVCTEDGAASLRRAALDLGVCHPPTAASRCGGTSATSRRWPRSR